MSNVVIWSENPDFKCLKVNETSSLRLKSELFALRISSNVVKQSIKLYSDASKGLLLICCDVRRDRGTEDTCEDIQEVEPIAFLYPSALPGNTSPKVFSDRKTFPRTLSHLNPIDEDLPASLCISRNSSDDIYVKGGITAVVDRVCQWITDAAYGRLEKDGWEPRIIANFGPNAQMNIAMFQEVAAQIRAPKIDGQFIAVLFSSEYEDKRANNHFFKIIETKNVRNPEYHDHLNIYCPLVIAGQNNRSNRRSDQKIETASELLVFSEEHGIASEVKTVLDEIYTSMKSKKETSSLKVLLIAIHRDQALRSSMLGQSVDEEASKVEIVGFMLDYRTTEGETSLEFIWQLNIIAHASPSLASQLSGNPLKIEKSVAFVGAGAVGGLMASNHVKAGLSRATIIDHDDLMPHNLARHVLPPFCVGMNKAIGLKHHLEIYPQVSIQAVGKKLDSSHLSKLKVDRFDYIIDSSSNPSVRKQLSNFDKKIPVVNVSIANAGKLGLFISEDKDRHCRIDSLFTYLYDLSFDHEEIRAWLKEESDEDEVILGMGCSTVTSRIPQATIEGLTSIFFLASSNVPTQEKARILITVNDGDGVPLNTIRQEITPYSEYAMRVTDDTSQWTCRVFDTVMNQLINGMEERTPIEAGGFLYGKIDVDYNIITIVRAIKVQPLVATETKCVLPPEGKSSEHREYMRRTAGTLQLLGTWHSHPKSLSEPSPTDNKLVHERKSNDEFPFGGVMLIIGEKHDLSITCIL